jgi:transposase
MESPDVAGAFKKSRERKALMVFVDEAGFSMVPCLKATWAPVARTPVVKHRNRWHRKVSVIGAIALEGDGSAAELFCDWHPDKHVTKDESAAFLEKLLGQFPGRNITLIWDKLQAHRSAKVREFVESHGQLEMHFLPSYAPELNPVEMVWSLSKYHRMANHGIDDLDELHAEARRQVSRVAHEPALLQACLQHAGLADALYHASAQ